MNNQAKIIELSKEEFIKQFNIKHDIKYIPDLIKITELSYYNDNFYTTYIHKDKEQHEAYNSDFTYKKVFETTDYITPLKGTWYKVIIDIGASNVDLYITKEIGSCYKLITQKIQTLKYIKPQICPLCDKEHTSQYIIEKVTEISAYEVYKHEYKGFDIKLIASTFYDNWKASWDPQKTPPICEYCLKELEIDRDKFINAINYVINQSDMMSLVHTTRELLHKANLYLSLKQFIDYIKNKF